MVNCGMRYNVKELLVLTHKEHYFIIFTWIEYKKGTLGFGDRQNEGMILIYDIMNERTK